MKKKILITGAVVLGRCCGNFRIYFKKSGT